MRAPKQTGVSCSGRVDRASWPQRRQLSSRSLYFKQHAVAVRDAAGAWRWSLQEGLPPSWLTLLKGCCIFKQSLRARVFCGRSIRLLVPWSKGPGLNRGLRVVQFRRLTESSDAVMLSIPWEGNTIGSRCIGDGNPAQRLRPLPRTKSRSSVRHAGRHFVGTTYLESVRHRKVSLERASDLCRVNDGSPLHLASFGDLQPLRLDHAA